MTILRALVREGYSVAAILHDPNIAALYADHLVCLKDGKLIEAGEGAALQPEILESVYGMQLTPFTLRGKVLVFPDISAGSPSIPHMAASLFRQTSP